MHLTSAYPSRMSDQVTSKSQLHKVTESSKKWSYNSWAAKARVSRESTKSTKSKHVFDSEGRNTSKEHYSGEVTAATGTRRERGLQRMVWPRGEAYTSKSKLPGCGPNVWPFEENALKILVEANPGIFSPNGLAIDFVHIKLFYKIRFSGVRHRTRQYIERRGYSVFGPLPIDASGKEYASSDIRSVQQHWRLAVEPGHFIRDFIYHFVPPPARWNRWNKQLREQYTALIRDYSMLEVDGVKKKVVHLSCARELTRRKSLAVQARRKPKVESIYTVPIVVYSQYIPKEKIRAILPVVGFTVVKMKPVVALVVSIDQEESGGIETVRSKSQARRDRRKKQKGLYVDGNQLAVPDVGIVVSSDLNGNAGSATNSDDVTGRRGGGESPPSDVVIIMMSCLRANCDCLVINPSEVPFTSYFQYDTLSWAFIWKNEEWTQILIVHPMRYGEQSRRAEMHLLRQEQLRLLGVPDNFVVQSALNGSQGSVGDKDDVELASVVQAMIISRRVYDEVFKVAQKGYQSFCDFVYEPMVCFSSYFSVSFLLSHPCARTMASFNRLPNSIENSKRHVGPDGEFIAGPKFYFDGRNLSCLKTQEYSSNFTLLYVGNYSDKRVAITTSEEALRKCAPRSEDCVEISEDVLHRIGNFVPMIGSIETVDGEVEIIMESYKTGVMMCEHENYFHFNTMNALSRIVKIGKIPQRHSWFWINFLVRFYSHVYTVKHVRTDIEDDWELDDTFFGFSLDFQMFDLTSAWMYFQYDCWELWNSYRLERYVWSGGTIDAKTGELFDIKRNASNIVSVVVDKVSSALNDEYHDMPDLGTSFDPFLFDDELTIDDIIVCESPTSESKSDIASLLEAIEADQSPLIFPPGMLERTPEFNPIPHMPLTSRHSAGERYSSGVDSGIAQLGLTDFWSVPMIGASLHTWAKPKVLDPVPRPGSLPPTALGVVGSSSVGISDGSPPSSTGSKPGLLVVPRTIIVDIDDRTDEVSVLSSVKSKTRRGTKAGKRHKGTSVCSDVVTSSNKTGVLVEEDVIVPFSEILVSDGKVQTKLYKAQLSYERWFRGKEFPTAYSSDPRDLSASGAGYRSFSYVEVDFSVLESFKMKCCGITITGERTIKSVRHSFVEFMESTHKRLPVGYELEVYPLLALQHLMIQQITDNVHGMSSVYISYGTLNAMAPSSTLVEYFLSNIKLSRRSLVITSLMVCSLVCRKELSWLLLKALSGCFRLESTLRLVLHQIAVSERLSVPVQFIRDKHTGLLLPQWNTLPIGSSMTK